MKEFWIIDTESPGEISGSCSAVGPFASYSDAANYIREDCRDTYMSADGSLRDMSEKEHWAEPMHIVRVIRTVRPTPSVKVKVQLKEVKP